MAASDTHIVASFDRDLEALQAHLLRMGGLVEAALIEAARALEAQDLPAAEKVIDGDKAVDALEDFIQTEAATLIARRAPTASDLRLVLAVMRAAHSLERVGDYAKNVAKRTRVLGRSAPVEGHAGTIRRMSLLVARMLEDAQLALVRKDATLAAAVRGRDVEIDQMYNALFRSLFTYMMESAGNIGPSMHLHFIAKNIERAGDHATTIAEQAYYLATGTMPADPRPKGEAATEPAPQT
ncbi:phosphate signaling complex protein PhoU [Tabrizicola piscis]|uniref:Phosphate-specific transport system accessory protein PhoU n=1 Tax=Tabrizicola piscis TaxID=2494374 RepID=A0A3S8UB62_9RHOB|nr:phosphate signaling complex protein PhoU [Tabrizicola piscis]AZL60788.1 phosphate signaling complex protein PhoU [Tabrizicola piscis]